MQSLIGGAKKTGALLFVRSIDDVDCAAQTVNEILARGRTLDSTGDVLGILVSEEIDLTLSVLWCRDASAVHDHVTLRESVALSGIWSLCWFDIRLGDERTDADERRGRLLDAVVFGLQADRPGSTGRCVFFPVLTVVEAHHEVKVLLDDLKARYSALTFGRGCFVHLPARGGLVRLAECGFRRS